MTRRGTALVAVLLVSSAVLPFVAVGQSSSNTYVATITGNPEHAVVNQEDITGDFTVEVITDGVPGRVGQNVTLVRERVGPGTEKYIQFNNARAYENVTLRVTVHGSGTPKFGDGSKKGLDIAYVIGATGGDRDLQCGTGEQIGSLAAVTITNIDCTTLPGSTAVNTTGLDAQQAKVQMYQSAQNQKASSEVYQTTLKNYLDDTTTQARILGKNAYIRALNNGSSKPAAKTAAKQAVSKYYAKKQANLIKRWNIQLQHWMYLNGVASNKSGISPVGHSTSAPTGFTTLKVHEWSGTTWDGPRFEGTTTQSVTLVNASSTSTLAVGYSTSSGGTAYSRGYGWANPTTGSVRVAAAASGGYSNTDPSRHFHWDGLVVSAPNSNYNSLYYMNFSRYGHLWSEIQSQHSQVQQDMDVLVNNTYSEYQAGEINNSELIDPYVFSKEFSPGSNYQGWAAAQLTMMGINSPKALDETGHFNVTTASGEQYRGLLMSQANPSSGQFAVNQTYDPRQIDGTQWVITDSRMVELTENFTITEIRTTDGQARQNVTIEKTTYETADVNTTQLRQMYEDLAYLREQIEARKEARRNAGGGSGFLNGGSMNQTVALVALAALAGAALIGRA